MKVHIKSHQELRDLARKVLDKASKNKKPIVIALRGSLGAGKTSFVKALAKELGVEDVITSPTFLLVKTIQIKNQKLGFKNLVHIDVYRVAKAKEMLDLGLEEILKDTHNIIVIEWPQKIEKYLPPHTVYLDFTVISRTAREIIISNGR